MRMFISDSLRPPGLEHLNTPGPLYALREDQSTWVPRQRAGPSAPPALAYPPTRTQPWRFTEKFGSPAPPPRAPASRAQSSAPSGVLTASAGRVPPQGGARRDETPVAYPYDETDDAWSEGRANRTPEQAMAEYWGDGWVVSQTATGSPEAMGQAYGSAYAWGDTWKENGGNRYMRYESIPFWQQGGREGYDYDIEETLGTAGRELDAHVRRWDMDRVRNERGQNYRRFGPRSGPIV